MPAKKKIELGIVEPANNVTPPVVEMQDEMEPEEVGIFPDGSGPSQAMVDLWKSRYGQIYSTEVDEDEYFVWRVLTRGELKGLTEIGDSDGLYKEELICEKCVLWPTDLDFSLGKAGVPSVLAEQIFEKSGFGVRSGPIPL